MLWRLLARPLLFCLPPERVHQWSMWWFHRSMFPPLSSGIRRWTRVSDRRLACRVAGLDFANPVGLAAGFDKHAVWFDSLGHLGFSHVEVGTITGQAQPGNPLPRLFRLPADRALINRMGFNNPGADAVAGQLAGHPIRMLIGINIGKTRAVDLDQAVDDYRHSFRTLYPWARYFTVNVSSPNTPGLRQLQQRERLHELLDSLQQLNQQLAIRHNTQRRPLFLKIAPELDEGQIEEIAGLALDTGLAGLIATNTTVSREGLHTPRQIVQSIGDGGLSGGPLTRHSRQVVARLYRICRGRIPVIGAGGILQGEDAWQMICHGASLVQVYTGFVYGGPGFVRQINRHLVRRLDESGMEDIGQATGSAVPAG